MKTKYEGVQDRGTGRGENGTGEKAETVRALPGAGLLSDRECALARDYVTTAVRLAHFEAGQAALVGDAAGQGIDRARSARAGVRLRALLAWAGRFSLLDAETALRAVAASPILSAATEARRQSEVAERASAMADAAAEIRHARQVAHELDRGQRSPLGTADACIRRRLSNAGALAPLAGPAAVRIRPAACRSLSRPDAVTGPRLAGLAMTGDCDAWRLAPIAARAEAQARRWVRGTQTRTAARKEEIGGASGADDNGAYLVKVQQEACAIFRGEALFVAGELLSKLRARGVRVNRSAWAAITGTAARQGSKRGRAAAEAWEYGAIKARDGREVGGGWALQGSLHGLADFALGDIDGWRSDAPDDSEADELAAESEAPAVLGHLRNRPTAGEGTGPRPSIVASLDTWADGVRKAFADRVRAATNAAAAGNAKAAESRTVGLIDGLASYVRGKHGPDPDLIAEFFGLDGNLSDAGKKRLSRLRQRSGLSKSPSLSA